MMETGLASPEFPPLMTGVPTRGDAVSEAVRLAPEAEPGTVVYAERDDRLEMALILAPDRTLRDAAGAAFVVGLGLNDALGALCPPEIGVHLEWPGGLRLNGAPAGRVRLVSPETDPDVEPDWLVAAVSLDVAAAESDPGTRSETTLQDEGAGDIAMPTLIEATARHMMLWLHIWLTDGFADVGRAWHAVAWRRGETIDAPAPGVFLGLDDAGGLILKTDAGTEALPLTLMLERP